MLRRFCFLLLATFTLFSPFSGAADQPDTYGCIFIVDGLRGDMACKYAEEGLMPNVKKYFLNRGVWVEKATTVFPSITGAAIPSLITGAFPGRHGIPSLYFFERNKRKYYVLYTFAGSRSFNKLLDKKRTKTIFEYFPGRNDTWCIGLPLTRGADKSISVAWNVGYKPLVFWSKLGEFFRGIKRMITRGKKARLVVIYNGWFDHKEHALGVESDALREHYAAVDAQLGEAINMYQKLGIFEKTYFVLASDHGQLGFEKNVDIWDFIKDTYHVPIVENDWIKPPFSPISWDVRNPKNYQDYSMVVAAGQAHALLYFAMQGKRNSWDQRPTFDLLRHYPWKGKEFDIIEIARNENSVDFCICKNRFDGGVRIFGKGTAEARIDRRFGKEGTIYRYTVAHSHTCPLGFLDISLIREMVNRDPNDTSNQKFYTSGQWQMTTLDTFYPDAVVQLYQIFNSERSPDLFISGAPGYNLIGSTYKGEISRHGALNKYEMWATLAISGPGLSKQTVRTARTVDMVPTLLHCMKVPFDPNFMDGEVIPEVGVPGL